MLPFSVLANTEKVYGKEIALGAPANPTQKSGAGPIVEVQGVIAMAACQRR